MRAATTSRLWGALRYGPSSSSGPDAAAKYLEMTPAEIAGLKCIDFYKDREVIIAAKSQLSEAQRQAFQDRAFECTGSIDPGLRTHVIANAPGEIAGEVVRSALGADGALGGIADIIGNTVLALAGVGLMGLGVARVFGVTPRSAISR